MFKKIISGVILSLTVSTAAFAISSGPNFVLLPNIKTQYLMSVNAIKASTLENRAIELVKSTLNLANANEYQTVRIRVIYDEQNQVKALIVYLLSSRYKSYELVRINVSGQFTAESVIRDYKLTAEDYSQSPNYSSEYKPRCPDKKVQFVIGNNFTGDASVENEVQKVYQLAKENGYNPVLMDTNNVDGPQPTVKSYEDWMSCSNVKGFYNESHGSESGILLSDDDFTYSLVEKDLVNKLSSKVVLFDSCVTFHDPLLSSMTDAAKGNSQQYVAGIIYLPFGASERTASCFWAEAFNHKDLNRDMLTDCSIKNDLDPQGFGITGNGDNHLNSAS
jgi:hypothetical protein